MKPAEEILSFMDLLDLDEEMVDIRAKNIMERKTFTNEHLSSLINLLQYKQLINTRENSECSNNEEYNFIGKLIINANEDNVDLISKIIILVLSLNPSSVINKSEHLIQQILSDIYLPSPKATMTTDIENDKLQTTLLQLKICASILDAVKLVNSKLSLPYLDVPLENIICSKNVNLRVYFLTHTVSRFFEAIMGYNILDRIWNLLKQSKEKVGEIALQVLCCLSNYYLPVPDESGKILFESDVIYHSEFWDLIAFGLLNKDDNSLRKKAIYLAKRAIDCVVSSDKSVNVTSKTTFSWNPKNKTALKKMWDNYFILIDSLEEKQSNIVLPSLKLFDAVKSIGNCWLTCAFNIGLCHDNAQVRYKCLEYRLQIQISNEQEAVSILEAINDINLFEHGTEYEPLNRKLKNILKDSDTLLNIMTATPRIKWSPVPLYHLTTILADTHVDGLDKMDPTLLIGIVSKILKIQCNNVTIRKAVHINMSMFIGNNCKRLSWKEFMYLYPLLKLDLVDNTNNQLVKFIKEDLLISDVKQFLQLMSFSHNNIDFALIYFEGHEHVEFLKFINDIIKKINDINSRQYAKKTEYLDEAIFIVQLYKKTMDKHNILFDKVNDDASISLETILQYVSSLLRCDMSFDIEKITMLFEGLDFMNSKIISHNNKELLIQLYKSTVLLLEDNNIDIEKKTMSIFVLNTCLKSPTMLENYKHELLELRAFINTVLNVKVNENTNRDNSGRLRNVFYEKSCEIVLFLIDNSNYSINTNILDYVYNVLNRGGYGCLKWLLQIVNKILPKLLDNKDDMFNLTQFLNRIWNEIEELKSNSQYTICIKQFVIIITQDALLKRPEFNNIVVLYCSKILEYAAIKNAPLYYLVKQINEINISNFSHMVYILSEILLYAYIPKKDHRIAESVAVDILEDPRYGINGQEIFFNYHIKLLAVSVLSKINDTEILNTIKHFIMKRIDELFKNKQRYHGNSQHERSLLSAIQNLLFIVFKNRDVDLDSVLIWVMDFLGRIPHQPYVRTCFEWYIALYYYLKGNILNDDVLNQLKAKNVPIQSQLMIFYFIITHKIKVNSCLKEEYDYVMDVILSNIMGPIYGIRLYAQYLSTRVYDANSMAEIIESQKYSYTVNVIKRTLTEASELKDKSFMKLLDDPFVHIFDIVEDLTPLGIYWAWPKCYDIFNDVIQSDFMETSFGEIEKCISDKNNDKFLNEWRENRKWHSHLLRKIRIPKKCNNSNEECEETSTIQKKYVPWKNMSDIDVCSNEKKKTKSDLIVVASLIDKLPNLGGMARTGEVFGVQTYVVDSLRRLQDKQFQGLSVSAERWINVEEVRPGNALKDYLMIKKAEGYSIVAAEQTSSSSPLQKFKFPKKTLLLLGHEKEGVPCDILPLMDHCIEIPQQGVIRSLNVHVTAAIFIWEYARQNML